jgi:hypothetical protein
MCHRLPSIAKMNSSRRPSPLAANAGDPNNLGMLWFSGWNPSSTHSERPMAREDADMGKLLDALNAAAAWRLKPEIARDQVAGAFQTASRRVGKAVDAARQPNLPLRKAGTLTLELPPRMLAACSEHHASKTLPRLCANATTACVLSRALNDSTGRTRIAIDSSLHQNCCFMTQCVK